MFEAMDERDGNFVYLLHPRAEFGMEFGDKLAS